MYFFPFSTMALMVLRIVLFGTEERIFHWKYSRFIQYFVANALWIKAVLIYSMQSSMYVCAVFRRNNFWIPTTKKPHKNHTTKISKWYMKIIRILTLKNKYELKRRTQLIFNWMKWRARPTPPKHKQKKKCDYERTKYKEVIVKEMNAKHVRPGDRRSRDIYCVFVCAFRLDCVRLY